jgi:PAS domain S-box-containing protein
MPLSITDIVVIALFLLSAGLIAYARRTARDIDFLRRQVANEEERADRAVSQLVAETTAREQTEALLHTSEGRSKAIFEAAVDAIITIDEHGRIQTFNRAAERIFQYRAAEVMGLNINILMPEPYHSGHDGYLRNYAVTRQPHIIGIGREVTGLRKDGSTFPMDLAVGESVLEGRRIFAGIVRDISERKQAEQQLFQSEERFRLLVEGVRDYAISLLDADGVATSWNQGAQRMHGWAAEEVMGQPFAHFFNEEDRQRGEPERILAVARREGGCEADGWRRRKAGGTYWAHETITRLTINGGMLHGFVRIARDMTEARNQEVALRRAKDEAERANMAKSKFLAAASHDLRQPVQALVFFTSALRLKITGTVATSMLAEIQLSLEGLNVLLESLLDVSRLDAGIVSPQIEDFALAERLDRLRAEFTPAAEEKGLSLRIVSSTAFVHSDATLIERIARNLVGNAIRYTEAGKVVVGIRRRQGRLWLEVWDSGIGIPPERMEDIFEEFTQLGNPERDRAHGLGLGLSIVRRLCRLLEHRLVVRSQPGHGSVFAVELPEGRPRLAAAQPALEATGDQRLVVVIDDEASVLKGLSLILEEWGFEVLAAGSEEEAVRLLEQGHRQPNAILADYRLRDGRTGAEAVRHIRSLFDSPIPSIIITGDTAPERLREAEASGFSILHKPVQPPHLHNLLDNAVASTTVH